MSSMTTTFICKPDFSKVIARLYISHSIWKKYSISEQADFTLTHRSRVLSGDAATTDVHVFGLIRPRIGPITNEPATDQCKWCESDVKRTNFVCTIHPINIFVIH